MHRSSLWGRMRPGWLVPSAVVLSMCIHIPATHAQAPACAPIPSGLISFWPGEGDARDAMGLNDGTAIGSVTFVPGMVGTAFRFSGGYVQVPDHPSLNLTQGLSLVLWFNRDAGISGFQSMIAKRETSVPPYPANYGVNFRDPSYGLGAYYDDPSFDYPANGSDDFNHFEISRLPLPLPTAGVFHHLAATYTQLASSVVIDIYLDGALAKSKELPGTLAASLTTRALEIATTIPGFEPFRGILDEIQLYDRPLTPIEVKSIFDAGSTGFCTSMAFASLSIDDVAVTYVGPEQDGFEFTASYELAPGMGSFDPATEEVSIAVGRFRQTLPAGSFSCTTTDVCSYSGQPGGIEQATITPETIYVKASGLNIARAITPLTWVNLIFGSNHGNESIRLKGTLSYPN